MKTTMNATSSRPVRQTLRHALAPCASSNTWSTCGRTWSTCCAGSSTGSKSCAHHALRLTASSRATASNPLRSCTSSSSIGTTHCCCAAGGRGGLANTYVSSAKSDEEWRHEQSGAKWSGATQRKARAKAGELNAASSYTRGAGRQVQRQLSSAQPLNSALQLKQAKRPQTTALESHNTQGMTQVYTRHQRETQAMMRVSQTHHSEQDESTREDSERAL